MRLCVLFLYWCLLPVAIQAQVFGEPVFKLLPVPTNVNVSFRGVSVVNDDVAWVSGSKGTIGVTTVGTRFMFTQVKGYEQCDFRSIYAFDAKTAIIANAGSPAYVLRTTDGGATWQKLYENTDTAAFIDGIDFSSDEQHGLIYGDPINGKMLLLKTTDSGKTWQEIADAARPVLNEGEASFAASGTAIRYMKKGRVLIATGGRTSRLFYSANDGEKWWPIATPILQGSAGTGIFSVLPLTNRRWLIAGGDYTREKLSTNNFFYTKDGGSKWIAPKGSTRGYRECLTIINGAIIAVGPTGVDYSSNFGRTWLPLSDETGLHVARMARKGTLVILAGSNGKIMAIQR